MKLNLLTLLPILLLLMLASCEQEYIPIKSGEGPKYVVEGYLEAGEAPFPTYVILTRTFDFFSEIGPDQFNSSFVRNAVVIVSDGEADVVLPEVCLSQLDPAIRKLVAAQFGLNSDTLSIDFCVYVDLLGLVQPEEGRTYTLRIEVDTDVITATTTIPPHVRIDSLRFLPPPGKPNDSLAQLKCFLADPPGVRNFYRYFGSTNGGPYEKSFSTVEEDLFFDGKSFDFQLFNPATTNGNADPDQFGLYFVGDTVTIKWCSIDEAHFDFWNTLEFSNANQGPFASYTRLQSNINGGLGIWGGYSISYYTRVVAY